MRDYEDFMHELHSAEQLTLHDVAFNAAFVYVVDKRLDAINAALTELDPYEDEFKMKYLELLAQKSEVNQFKTFINKLRKKFHPEETEEN